MIRVRWLLTVCLFCFGTCVVIAQQIIWSDTVIAFSSEKSDKLFSAKQATGPPNRYPNPAFTTCAWSPTFHEGRDSEFIQVGFPKPVVGKEIFIVENHMAGHIRAVYAMISGAGEKMIYKRPANAVIDQYGRMLVIPISSNTAPVVALKLVLDPPALMNTYQIDAIGISEVKGTPLPEIHLAIQEFPAIAERLGNAVNSAYDEVYPVVAPDGKTLYFDRKLHPQNIGDQKADDIWYSRHLSGTWTEAVNLGGPLNNDSHNFLCSISPDGNSALVGNTYAGDAIIGGGVSETFRVDGKWTAPKPVRIDAFENINPYNEFHLSPGGDILIMSIETAAGTGLLDICVSFRAEDGSFSKPLNIGKNINTAGNEMTPFLAADGKTLYFSSNGFPGFGNQDIYMAKRLDDTWQHWTEPLNLGPEVNTPEWDVYFSIDAKGAFGYFSSSKSAVTNLDIYRIKMPPELQPGNVYWLKGVISDKITGEALEATLNFKIEPSAGPVSSGSSNAEGDYALILPGAGTYRLLIKAEGYLSTDTLIDLAELAEFNEAIRNFQLIPARAGVIVQIPDILFKVNSHLLEDTSFQALDRIVQFLQLNAGVSIEIRGHTNGLCDADYCNSLSERRAKQVATYITEAGIEPGRLTYKGYGKTMPIADNKTPEGRQANQRVEFMITGIKP